MQRVSSLLPLWDRNKQNSDALGRTGTASATAATGHHNNRSSTSSSISTTNLNRFSNNSNATVATTASHRNGGRSINKVFSWADRIGGSKTLSVSPSIANAAARPSTAGRMGREAYWPTALDRECEKAARILKSFCTDGFLDETAESPAPTPSSPTSLSSPRFLRRSADIPPTSPTTASASAKKKIPPRIIQEAVGLAIFSCMRSGLWMSGSGGSGILIARKADGTWSPPSGILLHTSTVAFVMGVDIYDCVLVINSVAALELFTRSRVTLGADVPLTVGPLVTMGLLENDVRLNHEMDHTVLTYLKARGCHRPAQLYGSLVTERSNENERFYSDEAGSKGPQPIDILDILAGNVRKSIPEIVPLYEAIKAAEGRIDFDAATMERLSQQPAPGDADIADTPGLLTPATPSSATFGIPDASDPDPFGIIALEMAGLEIREAGTKHRPSSHQFDYNASPTSPLFASHFNRQSGDVAPENGSRASYMSTRTQATSMTDAGTQTTRVAETPDTSLSPNHSDDGKDAQTAIIRDVSSPVPELSVQAAPSLPEDAAPTADEAGPDGPPPLPPRNRASKVDVEDDKRSSKYLTVDRALDVDGHVSDGDDTAASSHYLDDERDGDADDEDEETDDLGDDADDADDVDDADDDDLDDDDLEEEPVIFEVAATAARPVRVAPAQVTTQVTQVIHAKGALVNIPKRVPPPLPVRSPARNSRASKSDYGDMSAIGSPMRHSFQSATAEPLESLGADVSTKAAEEEPASAISAETVHGNKESLSSSSSSATYESAPDLTVVEKTASGDETKRPSTPQASGWTASSVDDSDREPQTPRPDKNFDGVTNSDKTAVAEQRDELDFEPEHLTTSKTTIS